jgi:DNA polymerase-3 subunit gamma/tau
VALAQKVAAPPVAGKPEKSNFTLSSSSVAAAPEAPPAEVRPVEVVVEAPDPTPVVNETPEDSLGLDLQAPVVVPKAAAPIEAAASVEEAAPVDAQALWTSVLVAVRRDRPLITTWLEAGMLVEVTDNAVRLAFPTKQSMAMESLMRPNNRAFLEKLFAQLVGEPRVLECEAREGLIVEPAILPPPEPEPAPVDPMEEFKNDPLIRKALEIFQAEIQPAV